MFLCMIGKQIVGKFVNREIDRTTRQKMVDDYTS